MRLLGIYNKEAVLDAIRSALSQRSLIQAKAREKDLDSADSKRNIKSSVRT